MYKTIIISVTVTTIFNVIRLNGVVGFINGHSTYSRDGQGICPLCNAMLLQRSNHCKRLPDKTFFDIIWSKFRLIFNRRPDEAAGSPIDELRRDHRGKNQQISSPCLRVTVVKATVAMAAPTATVVSRIASSRDAIATPFGDRVLEFSGVQ